jgi:hypothetical protein
MTLARIDLVFDDTTSGRDGFIYGVGLGLGDDTVFGALEKL